MRDLCDYPVDQHRIEVAGYGRGDNKNGAFMIPFDGRYIRVIASSAYGWDHISVSLEDRVPTYYEMEYIAKLFFKEGEVAVQYHLPEKDHINIHPFVLHWWRSYRKHMPTPPKEFV